MVFIRTIDSKTLTFELNPKTTIVQEFEACRSFLSASHNPRVIILSGGPHSVDTPNATSFSDEFVDYVESNGVYVLGICYGLQLIVQKLGGLVKVGEKQEYGRMEIEVEKACCGLFGPKTVGDRQVVWMSHGDEVAKLPDGFEVVAKSQQGAVAAVENTARRFYGLQYHPEVVIWFDPHIKAYFAY